MDTSQIDPWLLLPTAANESTQAKSMPSMVGEGLLNVWSGPAGPATAGVGSMATTQELEIDNTQSLANLRKRMVPTEKSRVLSECLEKVKSTIESAADQLRLPQSTVRDLVLRSPIIEVHSRSPSQWQAIISLLSDRARVIKENGGTYTIKGHMISLSSSNNTVATLSSAIKSVGDKYRNTADELPVDGGLFPPSVLQDLDLTEQDVMIRMGELVKRKKDRQELPKHREIHLPKAVDVSKTQKGHGEAITLKIIEMLEMAHANFDINGLLILSPRFALHPFATVLHSTSDRLTTAVKRQMGLNTEGEAQFLDMIRAASYDYAAKADVPGRGLSRNGTSHRQPGPKVKMPPSADLRKQVLRRVRVALKENTPVIGDVKNIPWPAFHALCHRNRVCWSGVPLELDWGGITRGRAAPAKEVWHALANDLLRFWVVEEGDAEGEARLKELEKHAGSPGATKWYTPSHHREYQAYQVSGVATRETAGGVQGGAVVTEDVDMSL